MGGPTFLRVSLAVEQYRATICSQGGGYYIMAFARPYRKPGTRRFMAPVGVALSHRSSANGSGWDTRNNTEPRC
jgi:hypothetical protein